MSMLCMSTVIVSLERVKLPIWVCDLHILLPVFSLKMLDGLGLHLLLCHPLIEQRDYIFLHGKLSPPIWLLIDLCIVIQLMFYFNIDYLRRCIHLEKCTEHLVFPQHLICSYLVLLVFSHLTGNLVSQGPSLTLYLYPLVLQGSKFNLLCIQSPVDMLWLGNEHVNDVIQWGDVAIVHLGFQRLINSILKEGKLFLDLFHIRLYEGVKRRCKRLLDKLG